MENSKSTGIVIIGATFVDIKGYPHAQYIPGGRNSGHVVEVHGGVSRNIAEDIANIELRPTLITVVDKSSMSVDVVNKLKRHQCNTDYIRVTPDGLGTWLAVFDNSGDVVASISKRPDVSVIERILDEQGDEIFSNADSIAAEFDIEVPILKKIIALAEKHGKPIYCPVSNMSIAFERRDLLRKVDCLVCNLQEAGILFSEDYEDRTPEEMADILSEKIRQAEMPGIVVTMGGQGAAFARSNGEKGWCPSQKVSVNDTTGAGDAFFAGVAIGLTYGKTAAEACEIGTRLAASVIVTDENVCPRFMPAEFGLDVDKE
ncbi:MAG: bifunctional hydroxymethylpyrimidine kinase/phosphomethylpyrimidine kinase [Mogibacterium sp.]|nr:bifunctional hydroxymethylpyrimidine kinase/phosphomethylpyrimidine kinase [Mogibacterium sp.]